MKKAILSKKELNEVISNMKQNDFDKLNAGKKREQAVSFVNAVGKCQRATRISIIKKLVDLI